MQSDHQSDPQGRADMTQTPTPEQIAAERDAARHALNAVDVEELINNIATALATARNAALDEAKMVVTGWRERDYPEGFSLGSAHYLADILETEIEALKQEAGR